MKTSLPAALLAVLLPLLSQPALHGQDAKVASKDAASEEKLAKQKKASQAKAELYIRLKRDQDDQPVSLETAIVRYLSTKKPGVTVDLIGAVHVGEKEYYRELNNRFLDYDALLYELVAPEGARPEKGRGSGGAVSGLQLMMTRALELQFQLKGIDYTKKNFVHADMSPKEFSESMKKRGESVSQLFFRMMGQSFAMQGKPRNSNSNSRLLLAFMSKDHHALKRLMAEQFQEMEGTMKVLSGENGSTIIHERNKKALSVLQREIDAGKKRLGVFYGAGHLPDMDERLRAMGFKPVGRQWLVAWRLKEEKTPAETEPAAGKPPRDDTPAVKTPDSEPSDG